MGFSKTGVHEICLSDSVASICLISISKSFSQTNCFHRTLLLQEDNTYVRYTSFLSKYLSIHNAWCVMCYVSVPTWVTLSSTKKHTYALANCKIYFDANYKNQTTRRKSDLFKLNIIQTIFFIITHS